MSKRVVIGLILVSLVVAIAVSGVVGFFTYTSMHGILIVAPGSGGLTPQMAVFIAAGGTALIASWARRRRRR
jgi:hypothetical protein